MPDLDVLELLLLAGVGALAGAINAVAGGGSLISFPALLGIGLAPVPANATNLVALLPGYLGGAVGYRRELRGQGARLRALGATGMLGAGAGTAVLLLAPSSVFESLAPFLVLAGCAALAAQPALARLAGEHRAAGDGDHRGRALHAGVLVATVYGGYFGAGLGIVLLAVLGTLLDEGLQRLNALKGVLSLAVAVVAAAVLALFGPVVWSAVAVMAATSLAGGQAGASLARHLDERALRLGVVGFGVVAAAWLLLR